jgi:magnesium transporter
MQKLFHVCDGRVLDLQSATSIPVSTECPVRVYVNPDEAEKRVLIQELKIDEHTLMSALDPDELSRLEFEPEHMAVIMKRPKNYSAEDQYVFKVSSMGLFLFKDRLVIVAPEEMAPFEGRLFNKVASLQDLFLKIVWRTTTHYLEHLKIINAISNEVEAKINKAMENRFLINLFALEKGMVYYHNAIHSNGVVIEKMRAGAAKIGFTAENLEFLDDLVIENNQCEKQAEIYSNVFASLMDARVSVVSNNLNVLMKTLNLITIAIMVPTLVVSAFSMNVNLPLLKWDNAFWLIVGLAGISSAVVVVFWKLLGRR